jgi:hypothetical protein
MNNTSTVLSRMKVRSRPLYEVTGVNDVELKTPLSAYKVYDVIADPPLSLTSKNCIVIEVEVELRYFGGNGLPGISAALIFIL